MPESPGTGEKLGDLAAGEELVSSLRTSVDSDAEPEGRETEEVVSTEQRGMGGVV